MTVMQAMVTLGVAVIFVVSSCWFIMRPPASNSPLWQGMTESERKDTHRFFYKFVHPAFVFVLFFTPLFVIVVLGSSFL
ncbi:hypothetical protein AC1659_29210 [Rhodococcus erythropolis]|uniref:hypothetical protein n=1 Tax=Rhodococcus erythropolis TaxID=1833 RepID=UPI001BA9D708|nr:hypothetical protein [Rhodococcus erythropolis]MBS2993383.1 hypothetical protein [Rhodococcus erythropolis]